MHEKMPTAPLSELANFTMGQSPDSTHVNNDERGLPFLQGCADFGARSPSARVHCFPPLRIARAESTLISVRAPVGTMNRADRDYCIGRGLAAILAKAGIADNVFIINAIEQNLPYLHRRSQGSTFLAISSADLNSMPVAAPGLPMQQRIAEILSTVDEAIDQTEALIAKKQQINAGLMHDLFTRGVTADGQLRPPRGESPQLYKESPLGWIPKEWASATLNDVVSSGRPIVYGILMPGQGHPGGIPVIKVKDIIDGEVRGDKLLLTSPRIDAEYQRSKVRPRDILLTIRGTVGRLAQVPAYLDGANITQDTARIGIVHGVPEFYRHYLETHVPRRHFSINTLGQAVQGINLRDVRTTPVPIVPYDEQLMIDEKVIAAVRSVRAEQEHLAKLTQTKRGLMQDLLSGRMPVSIDASSDLSEVAENV